MIEPETNARFSHWPNRIAKLLALVVFPLIWVGGLVTTSDAGMAVPDWPNTYNYNMFAYPIRDWFFGPWDLFVEHGHRLLGSLSGLVAIALCATTLGLDRRGFARLWSIFILAMVIGQGVLGGQRVILNERFLALIHGCVGPACFAVVVAMVVFTSSWWIRKSGSVSDPRLWSADGARIGAAGLILVSYGQLVLGACLRHIPDSADPALYSLLLVAHLVTAAIVVLLAICVGYLAHARNWDRGGIRRTARTIFLVVVVQVALGATSYVVKFGWPAWMGGYGIAARFTIPEKSFWQLNLITLHVAVGSLILALATYQFVRVCRAVHNGCDQEQKSNASAQIT